MNDYKTSGKTTPWGRLHNITAQVAVPLLVDGRPVGTLAVLSYTDHRYEAPDALFLSLLAAIVTPALESARLASEVKRQARSVAQIYEALPVMVVVYGRDGKAIQHNSAAEAALGGELLDGVRERAIPLVWEDGTPIPADERPKDATTSSIRSDEACGMAMPKSIPVLIVSSRCLSEARMLSRSGGLIFPWATRRSISSTIAAQRSVAFISGMICSAVSKLAKDMRNSRLGAKA